jgi:hypothetical protein
MLLVLALKNHLSIFDKARDTPGNSYGIFLCLINPVRKFSAHLESG